jgi:hypothetical protein
MNWLVGKDRLRISTGYCESIHVSKLTERESRPGREREGSREAAPAAEQAEAGGGSARSPDGDGSDRDVSAHALSPEIGRRTGAQSDGSVFGAWRILL